MTLTKEDLQKMLEEQVKSITSSDEFGGHIKTIMQQMIKELQNSIVQPMSASQVNGLKAGLSYSKIDGDFLTTKQGSIINLKQKNTPWVAASSEMEKWAHAFAQYVKSGGKVISKDLAEYSDTGGGIFVPEEFVNLMIMYDFSSSLMWSRATVWPMAVDKISFPKLMQNADVNDSSNFDHFAGVTFTWTEEADEPGDTEPVFGLVEMIVHELSGYTEITNTLLEDAVINFLNYITRIFREAWYWYTDKSFITGTGGKQPLGILSDPGVITVNRQTASTIEVDDILNMDAALPLPFDSNAVWFYTKKARAALRGQKTTAGELVLREMYRDISDGYSATLLGRPAILGDGKIPNIGNYGDLVLLDPRWYYIGQRSAFIMESSRHYQFKKGLTALRCAGRIDGQLSISNSCVVLTDPS